MSTDGTKKVIDRYLNKGIKYIYVKKIKIIMID